MPDSIEDLTSRQQLTIRAHYACGLYSLDEALHRLRFDGVYTLTEQQASKVLSRPIPAVTVRELTGRDVTEEQIAARLTEVNG